MIVKEFLPLFLMEQPRILHGLHVLAKFHLNEPAIDLRAVVKNLLFALLPSLFLLLFPFLGLLRFPQPLRGKRVLALNFRKKRIV